MGPLRREPVADIIHFKERTPQARKESLLTQWALRMGYRLSSRATVASLPDRLILLLAESDPRGASLLEELVCLIILGKRQPVISLPALVRMRVLEISLFLLDLVRFECMTRLDWIEPQAAREKPLVEILSREPRELKELTRPLRLRQDHPHFHRFEALPIMEREAFLRRMIPQALELFRIRLNQTLQE